MSTLFRLVGAMIALTFALPCSAQTAPTYPTKSVRVVVPYPAGGPTDVIGRLVAQKLSERFGKQFYVENISGGSGAVGAISVSHAAPDGYAILFVTNDLSVAPTVAKVAYDPIKNFAPVTIVAASPQIIIANPSTGAKTMQDMIRMVKANPDKYTYGSLGIGFGQLTAQRLFQLGLHLDRLVRAPYQGAAPMITDAMAGHIQFGMLGLPPAAPLMKAGQLIGLAVSSPQRSAAFPNVPTLAESGIPNQDSELIMGCVVPAGTPKPIVELLNGEIAKIVKMPDVVAKFDALGFHGVANSSADYEKFLKSDYETWSKVAKQLGVFPQ